MDKVYQTAVFEGGVLRVMASGVKSREAALALPLGRLLSGGAVLLAIVLFVMRWRSRPRYF